jgi:hypothetical protein
MSWTTFTAGSKTWRARPRPGLEGIRTELSDLDNRLTDLEDRA